MEKERILHTVINFVYKLNTSQMGLFL